MTDERYLIRQMASGGYMVIDTAPRECRDIHGQTFICRHYVVCAGCTYPEAEEYIADAIAVAARIKGGKP